MKCYVIRFVHKDWALYLSFFLLIEYFVAVVQKKHSVGKKKNYKQFYEISGLEVWKQVVTFQPKNINLALKEAKLELKDIDSSHNYNFVPGALSSNITVTLPNATVDDQLTFNNATQTILNKTLYNLFRNFSCNEYYKAFALKKLQIKEQ